MRILAHAGAADGLATPGWLSPAFFLSGFAALIYQVVWQRVLFASFGINIEAVTVVVTAFLVGLGAGSVLGGELSRPADRPVLIWFAGLEFLVALYGLISVQLFHRVSSWAGAATAFTTGSLTFALVLVPTLLMGASLPLLVAYSVRLTGNVGRSVGWLYFVNTAGSAVAAIMAALVLMARFGERGSVYIAALANLSVSAFVAFHYLRTTVPR